MRPVKIHPKMQRWEHWEDSYCVHILLFLLMEAKQRKTSFKGVSIHRGQVVAGRGFISRGTGISEDVIRTRMKWMRMSGTFDVKVHEVNGEKFTVITIPTYEEYQQEEPQPMPAKRNWTAPNVSHDYTEDFEEWWKVYKKGTKFTAFQAWNKQKACPLGLPGLEELTTKTEEYREYCLSMDRPMMDGQGWLNQRYFENEWSHTAQGTADETKEGDRVTFG